MREQFKKDLEASGYIRRPLAIHEEETREARCEKKPVAQSVLFDDLQNLDQWETIGKYARMELDHEHVREGGLCKNSLKFTSVTRIDEWEGWRGFIYTVPSVMRKVNHENWEHVNRISFWVYPDMPGFRSICLRMQLHNEGTHPVPDPFEREGAHNVNLVDRKWQHVSVEIPYLHRDDVTGISFDYDMVGNESCATEQACWYITDIELETLEEKELDVYHGWQVGEHRIAFSGSGYQTGSRKQAIVNEPGATSFKVVETATGKVVLEKDIQVIETSTGKFQTLDFSELCEEGEYLIVCGSIISRSFVVNDRVWEDSIWKPLNFLFIERCGYEVPEKHMACHHDMTTNHDGKSITVDGGWHDAANMAQDLANTSEAAYGLFELLKNETVRSDEKLYERILDEAKWGLDWMLKTRFGDGYRAFSGGTSCWTYGIFGDKDDIADEAGHQPIENFMCAGTEALASGILRETDPILADYALKCAKEDWAFAWRDRDIEGPCEHSDPMRASSQLVMYACGVWSALDLYDVTGDVYYKDMAIQLGDEVIACQQQDTPDWKIPFTGFFYSDKTKTEIQHYLHRSHENEPMMALTKLVEHFPEHENWSRWYYAVKLYANYEKKASESTAPYYMMPASIYDEREAEALRHVDGPMKQFITEEYIEDYLAQMKNGIDLGNGFWLRRFPVWSSFRGNNALTLSGGKCAAMAGRAMNDYEMAELAQRQMEWIVGKNPFAQSVMFGEGYDYCQQYAVLPGEMVGELSVGIESLDTEDSPFWPHVCTAVYKEVWIHTTARWLWLAADTYGPATVKGILKPDAGDVVFTNRMTGRAYRFTPCRETGYLRATVPAGDYTVSYDGKVKNATYLPNKCYRLENAMAGFTMDEKRDGGKIVVTIHTSGEGSAELAVKCENMRADASVKAVTLGEDVTVTCEVIDPKKPWLALFIPNGNLDEKLTVFGE